LSSAPRLSTCRFTALLAGLLTELLLVGACAQAQGVALAPPEGRLLAEIERDREECQAKAGPSVGQVAAAVGKGIGAPFVGLLIGIPVGAALGFVAAAQGNADGLEKLAVPIAGGALTGAAVGFIAGLVTSAKVPAEELAQMHQAREECLRIRGYTLPPGDQQ
jgi:hypothetical protein